MTLVVLVLNIHVMYNIYIYKENGKWCCCILGFPVKTQAHSMVAHLVPRDLVLNEF